MIRQTFHSLLRHRAGGLAGEGAFFALLSLPPLVFGLAGSIGYVLSIFGKQTVETVRSNLIAAAREALTEQSVQEVIIPTLDPVLRGGRFDIVSVGFLLALWSGSRALNTVMQGISIMYEEQRGIVRARLLSLLAYAIGLSVGVIVLPLVVAGPDLIRLLLPRELDVLVAGYWPIVMVLSAGLLSAFYHFARPGGTNWRLEVPGALIAMTMWIVGSVLLRTFLDQAIGSASIYGPLAAPIVVLIWLYLVMLALLVGAGLNATLDTRRRRAAMAVGGSGGHHRSGDANGGSTDPATDDASGGSTDDATDDADGVSNDAGGDRNGGSSDARGGSSGG